MTSIQKQAAELADSFYIFGDEYTETDIAYQMADLLHHIASMGGDVEPVAWANIDSIIRGKPRHMATRKIEAEYFNTYLYCVDPLFTQQALDAARLAGFEAGRRKGLEDAADLCELDGALYTGFDMATSIRELINKEAEHAEKPRKD